MMLSDFHFLRPLWLLALLPFAGLLWRIVRRKAERGVWQSVCDAHLLPHILLDQPLQQKRWPWLCFGLGGVLAILALAGPVWERLPTPVFRNDSALVIVLDLSRSMDASDIKPSRLERARFKITDILQRRKDGQTALVVFAGDAFVVTPLTDDTATIQSQLTALNTQLIPVQGSRPESALKLAEQLLQQAGLQQGKVLLIGDGIRPDTLNPVAVALRKKGYQLSVLGVGTTEGAPIPTQGGFLKDRAGHIVIPRLDIAALRRIAEAGGGVYQSIRSDNLDLDALALSDMPLLTTETSESDVRQMDQWYEIGPWLLLVLLPGTAWLFRRGSVWLWVLCIVPLPRAEALDWDSLWQTADQRAYQHYRGGNPEAAADLFENPSWKAASYYRAGQYQQALEALEGLETGDAYYNKGNALAQLQQYPQAIQAYEQALVLDPENEDARSNKAAVEKLLEQQQENQQEQEKQQQDDQSQQPDPSSEASDPGSSDNESASGSDNDQANEQNASEQEDAEQEHSETGADAHSDPSSRPDASQAEQQSEAGAGKYAADDDPDTAATPTETPQQQDVNMGADNDTESRSAWQEDTLDEAEQANEQWLRRIPDDPGGLLKRKFQYQYKQRRQQAPLDEEAW